MSKRRTKVARGAAQSNIAPRRRHFTANRRTSEWVPLFDECDLENIAIMGLLSDRGTYSEVRRRDIFGRVGGPKLLGESTRATMVRGGATFWRIGGPRNRYLYSTTAISKILRLWDYYQIEVPIRRSSAAPKSVAAAEPMLLSSPSRATSVRGGAQNVAAADLGIGTSI